MFNNSTFIDASKLPADLAARLKKDDPTAMLELIQGLESGKFADAKFDSLDDFLRQHTDSIFRDGPRPSRERSSAFGGRRASSRSDSAESYFGRNYGPKWKRSFDRAYASAGGSDSSFENILLELFGMGGWKKHLTPFGFLGTFLGKTTIAGALVKAMANAPEAIDKLVATAKSAYAGEAKRFKIENSMTKGDDVLLYKIGIDKGRAHIEVVQDKDGETGFSFTATLESTGDGNKLSVSYTTPETSASFSHLFRTPKPETATDAAPVKEPAAA